MEWNTGWKCQAIGKRLDALRAKEGLFLSLQLPDTAQKVVSENFYWLPDSAGVYSGLQRMGVAAPTVETRRTLSMKEGKELVYVTLHNPPDGPVALEWNTTLHAPPPLLSVQGWNVPVKTYPVN